MLSTVFLAFYALLANPRLAPALTTPPTVAFGGYPATVQQPFVFTVQSHGPTQRVLAQLFGRSHGSTPWTCINWDLSHPVRRDAMVQDCGVLVPQGQSRTLRYTLSALDVYLLRVNCVRNQRADVKIIVRSCSRSGPSYGESNATQITGF